MPPVIPFPSEHRRPSLRRLIAEEIRISHNRLVRVGPETATALCGFLAGVALGLEYANDPRCRGLLPPRGPRAGERLVGLQRRRV